MGHEYAGVIGGSTVRRERWQLRRGRRAAPGRPAQWGWRVRRLAGLNTLDLRVLALLGIALAAAGAERTQGTLVGGRPASAALILRAAVVGGLALGGIAIQLSSDRRRIGRLLLAAAIVASLPLLHAPQHSVAVAIGLLSLSMTPAVFSFLMLASPSGRIDSPLERRFIAAGAGATLLLGLAVSIAPHRPVLSWLVRGAAVVITGGTAVFMVRRTSHVNPRARALHAPMATIAVFYAAATVAYVTARALGAMAPAQDAHEIANVAVALAIPVAIILGLAVERMSLGRALASFVSSLGKEPVSNVQDAMAATLNDPLLRIYYRSEETGEFLDPAGRRQPPAGKPSRRQTAIEGGGPTHAVIDYDADLYGQEEFLQAAATSALMLVEQNRLVADLEVAKSHLEASRLRLSHTADEERQRIQRDLHDGAQQHLIGMHVKVERALESLEAEPARCAELLAELGEEMGETARDLRSLATTVFPATLREYGLVDALASAIRTMGLRVHLETESVGRQPPEVERQVYFVCLEGLQNIGKYCGPDVVATLRIWAVRRQLFFELRDMGPGFDRSTLGDGLGLENMHDRLSSIGGRLSIVSSPGTGTLLKGVVPVRPANGRLR
jgi:signal transduction histidine kinase